MSRALKSLIISQNRLPLISSSGGGNSAYVCISCRIKAQQQQLALRGQKKSIHTRSPPSARPPSSAPSNAPSNAPSSSSAAPPQRTKIIWVVSKEVPSSSLQFTSLDRATHATLRSSPNSDDTSRHRLPVIPGSRLPARVKAFITARLSDFRHMQYEADVGSRDSLLKENRLVNMLELRCNYDLWRAILAFRRRVDGDKGVKEVFFGMKIRGVSLPTTGTNADKIWDMILDTALKDKEFLRDVLGMAVHGPPGSKGSQDEEDAVEIADEEEEDATEVTEAEAEVAEAEAEVTEAETEVTEAEAEVTEAEASVEQRGVGGGWPKLYEKIVGYQLLKDPPGALKFHTMLSAGGYAPPNWPEFIISISQEILTKLDANHKRAAFHRLREIHAKANNPDKGVYNKLIPFLAKKSTITEAFKWHKHLLANWDKPSDSSPANAIFEYLGMAGIMAEIRAFFDSFAKKNVPIAESSLVSLIKSRNMKDDILIMLVEKVQCGDLEKSVFGDRFWAVVFGDKGLEMKTIMGLMRTYGVKRLDKRALSALIKRVQDQNIFYNHVLEIRNMGVEVPDDILHKFQQTHQEELANATNISSSSSNTTTTETSTAPNKFLYDKILVNYITQLNIPSALRTLNDMIAFSIPVRPAVLRWLLRNILRPRRAGHGPKTLPPQQVSKDDLALAVNTLLSCLHGGLFVPPSLWKEIFRRLGKEYQLADLERLTVHLIEWYHPYRGQEMLKRYANAFKVIPHQERTWYEPSVRPILWDKPKGGWKLTNIRRNHKDNPLRRLFPRSFVMAIVDWGVMGVFRRKATILTGLPGMPKELMGPPPALLLEQQMAVNTSTFTTTNTMTRDESSTKGAPETISSHLNPLHTTSISLPPSPLSPTQFTFLSPSPYNPSPPPIAQPKYQTPLYGFSPTAKDITWGLRLSYYLWSRGCYLDQRTLFRALRVRARAIYGNRPEWLRSQHNRTVREFVSQELPSLEIFVQKINGIWLGLVARAAVAAAKVAAAREQEQGKSGKPKPTFELNSAAILNHDPIREGIKIPGISSNFGREIFPSGYWRGLEPGSVERKKVIERVVLGDLRTVERRMFRRWKGGRIEVGAAGRDVWGRWRLSGNERRRRGRVERERERELGVVGSGVANEKGRVPGRRRRRVGVGAGGTGIVGNWNEGGVTSGWV